MTFLGVNGAPRTFIPMTKTNVQPRIGFAYALDDRTVIRGGYGMMFRNPIPGDNNLGFSANTQFVSSFDNGIHQSGTTIDNPFPTGIQQPTSSSLGLKTGLGQGQWFINPHYKTPRYESYSLGMERQFLAHDLINVTYSGSRSTRQDSADNINHVSIAAMERCALRWVEIRTRRSAARSRLTRSLMCRPSRAAATIVQRRCLPAPLAVPIRPLATSPSTN